MPTAAPQHYHSLPPSPADTYSLLSPQRTARSANGVQTLFPPRVLTGERSGHRTSTFRHPLHQQLHRTTSLETSPSQKLLQTACSHRQERSGHDEHNKTSPSCDPPHRQLHEAFSQLSPKNARIFSGPSEQPELTSSICVSKAALQDVSSLPAASPRHN